MVFQGIKTRTVKVVPLKVPLFSKLYCLEDA